MSQKILTATDHSSNSARAVKQHIAKGFQRWQEYIGVGGNLE